VDSDCDSIAWQTNREAVEGKRKRHHVAALSAYSFAWPWKRRRRNAL